MKDEPGGGAEEIGSVGAAVFVSLAAGAGLAERGKNGGWPRGEKERVAVLGRRRTG